MYALQGNGIDRADTAGCNGCGWRVNEMYTLNTIDRPAVVFQQNQRNEVREMGERAGAICAQPGIHNQNYVCQPRDTVALDCRNMVGNEELSGTLQAKSNGGQSLNYQNPVIYRNGGYGDMVEGIGTLRANGGDAGGGTESIVVEHI